MTNRKNKSVSENSVAAELSRTTAQYLLENPPQASTPDLQAKQARLLGILTGDASTARHYGSTASAPASREAHAEEPPLPSDSADVGLEETEEDGIRAEMRRRERVRQMAEQFKR